MIMRIANMNMYHVETRQEIEHMCVATGFHIVRSYDVKRNDRVFGSGTNLCSFLWATTHGAFDPRLVTEDRLTEFCARYASKEAGSFKFFAQEGDSHSALVAVKPAI